jgi:OmpA-OmpF porin, OOP family
MKFIFCIIFFILHSLTLFSQNLVPNSSFEKYKNRPITGLSDYGIDNLLNGWMTPTKHTNADFYVFLDDSTIYDNYDFSKSGFGKQKAYDGNVFVGLLLQIYFGEYISFETINYREYIQAKLIKPMKKGHKYYASMYYKLSERSTYGIDGLGIYFSKEKIESNSFLLDYKPQVSNKDGNILTNYQWNKLEGYIMPENKLNYITIGNFKRYNKIHSKQIQPKDSVSIPYSYYLIDKIEVYEINKNDPTIDFNIYNQKPEPRIENMKINNIKLDSLNLKGAILKNDTLVLSDILFEFGKARLLPEHYIEFRKIVNYLVSSPNISVSIEGHTDSIGDHQLNLKLSLDRANAVATFLIANGIVRSRIKTFGYGENRPVGDNGTEKGRAQNRRVEIIFKKNN